MEKGLPEGDFTVSKHFPRIPSNMPDKSDFLDAQNVTIGKFLVK